MADSNTDIARTTQLLNLFGAGDRSVEDELLQRIHSDLQQLAGSTMSRAASGHTLQPTALVHEAWLRFAKRDDLAFGGRRSFFRFASQVMRSVLVDHARATGAEKRGSRLKRVTLSFQGSARERTPGGSTDVDLLDLDEALRKLGEREPELVHIVELRFFGGLTNLEIAEELETSLRTIERQWRFARAYLRTHLDGEPE